MDPLCFLLLTFELINWPSEKHKAESTMENLPENSEDPKILIFTGMRNHAGMSMEVSKWLVSWFITYLGDVSNLLI